VTRGLYLRGLDAALQGAGLPYGYTVTVWASGQVLIDQHGKPGVGWVLAFGMSAATAFGTLKLTSRGADPRTSASQLAADPRAVRTGAVHVATIAGAIGAVALLALGGTVLVWPLGGFVATTVYLGGTGFAMALREREACSDHP
jgi:hypothetical protein